MDKQRQVRLFEAVRLEDGAVLARARASALPGPVLDAALRSYLDGDASVLIRADGQSLLQINCCSGSDCCDRESDPELTRVDLRINLGAWNAGR